MLLAAFILSWASIASCSTAPSLGPTRSPTITPSAQPTILTLNPTVKPTLVPSCGPSIQPTSFLSAYNFIFQVAGASTSSTTVSVGGRATSCNLVGPKGVWQDSTGVMYVADAYDDCIVSFDLDGDTIVHNFAGKCNTGGNTGVGGQATAATIDGPTGLKGDTSGNIYFTDFNNVIVKKVSSSGILSKFAGNGATSDPVYGRPATSCSLAGVNDIWWDTLGNVYIVSQTIAQVSKVDTSGFISLVGGSIHFV